MNDYTTQRFIREEVMREVEPRSCGARLPNGVRIPAEFICQRPAGHDGFHREIIRGLGLGGGMLSREWAEPIYVDSEEV